MLQSRGVQSRQPTLEEAVEKVVPEGDNLLREVTTLIAYLDGGQRRYAQDTIVSLQTL